MLDNWRGIRTQDQDKDNFESEGVHSYDSPL